MGRVAKAFVWAAAATSVALTGAAFELALEAELANEIAEPMVIGVPGDEIDQGGAGVDEPSNGAWVWAPGPPVAGDAIDHKGHVSFVVEIPEDDTYYIWGSVVAWDGNSDSFWVTVTPADDDPNPQASQDTFYRWGVQQGPAWHWDRVNQWLNAGTFDREWELPAGEAVITIWTREAATMLDTIWITDSQGAAQGELPTDADRDAQLKGGPKAVEPDGKATTTWAGLKAR
ncbi:hypothetical protein CMK11_08635 [Candidatus Poribacteria bacterium]|nr:hypothetical protein [Candidatus Poribacteria bacterium]